MIDKLKPCPVPWCSDTLSRFLDTVCESSVWYVRCGGCTCQGPRKGTEAEAIAAWNERLERLEINKLNADLAQVREDSQREISRLTLEVLRVQEASEETGKCR